MSQIEEQLIELKNRLNRGEDLKLIVSDVIDILIDTISLKSTDFRIDTEDIMTFLKMMNLSNYTDKVLSIGYFLEKSKSIDAFTIKDLAEMFDNAREIPPKNMSDIVAKLTKKQFLLKAKEKKDNLKAWKLSKNGLEYVKLLMEK